jgi:SNF2 family DNA or RNA helicase
LIYAEKVNALGKDWIKVQFKPLAELVYSMNKVPGATLNPKTRLWAVPYENRQQFEDIMGDHLIIWEGEEPTGGGIDEASIPANPVINYSFKTKPFDYQIKGSNLIFARNFLILADEMGLGKSKIVIDGIGMKKQNGDVKRGVILCKATLVYNWKNEVEKHSDMKAVVLAGTPTQRARIFASIEKSDDWTFLIMGFDIFRLSIANLDDFDTFVGLDFLIVDEAHVIKNPNSQIGSLVHRIPFRARYLLTGTPLPNTPLESYNYLKLGGKMDKNWWQFRNTHAILGGYGKKEVVGYKNIKVLRNLINQNMLRRLKSEKLKELPDISFTTIPLKMTAGQQKLYNAIKKEIIEDLKDTSLTQVPNALSKLMRLQQVTDAPALIDSKEKSIKLEALDDLLENLIDEGKNKVVVFSRFRTMVEIMKQRYKKYKPAVIHGDIGSHGKPSHVAEEFIKKKHPNISDTEKAKMMYDLTTSERQKEVDRFQNDSECKLFLGCAPACREGLTLTASSYVVFIDTEWSPAYVSQAYSRCHRIGQKNCVSVYYLVCTGTIDEKVMEILERKNQMSQTLIDGGVKDIPSNRAKEFILTMIGE